MTDSRIGKTMKVTAEQFESLSEVNRISALKIGEQQAEIEELKEEVKEIVGRDGWVTVRQLKRLKLLLRIK